MSAFNRSLSPLTAAVLLALSGWAVADDANDEFEFNPYFMSPDSQQRIDLTRYNQDLTPVGTYRAELIVNGRRIGRDEVSIKDRLVDGKAVSKVDVCIKRNTLSALDINVEKLSAEAQKQINEAKQDSCLALNQLLPENSVAFDANDLTLNLDLPEIYLIQRPRGYVNPEQWDQGITAATLGYNLNASRTHYGNKDYDNLYGNLNAGFNLKGWYFRHNGIYTKPNDSSGDYNNINTFVQRDIAAIQGRLLVGDANTKGELFDTLSFRGAQIANEEQMLPNALRGYAPVVRGSARTAAKVVIRQSGDIIYEKNVAPGPFEITDLYPTGYGGNLDVTIEEADGSSQNFQMPYASTSNLLRPGTHHYSLTYGKLRSSWLKNEPVLLEGTYRRGINNSLTLYGGVQGNEDYQAMQGGTSIGTPIGAFSFDVTHAKTKLGEAWGVDQGSMSGQSYQLKYSQNIESTGSNLSVAAYRFSTDGYMDFTTGMSTREVIGEGYNKDWIRRAKNRLSVSAAQTLPEDYGQFYISAWQQAYWNDDRTDRQYQFGYNNRFKSISYGLNMTRSQDGYGKAQNTYMLNIMVPLDNLFGFNQMGITVNRGPDSTMNEQVFVNGTAGEDRQYNYNINAGMTRDGREDSRSTSLVVNGSARTPYTTVNALAGAGKGYETYSAGLSGAMVAHSGGLTLTPYSGDTYALVEAKGAKGAKMVSYPGIKVDSFGYAVVPYLTAYQMNDVEISPKGLSNNVELNLTRQKVAPYSGAVVKVSYDTTVGYPALINAPMANGKALPFGADVYDEQDRHIGVVGQGGRLFARVPAMEGKLKVIWGDAVDQQCSLSYLMPKEANPEQDNVIKFNSVCQ
ncbi:fimbrial biogenesis outer membrane usher protein [Budviciaceae bacterium BWR-B9]|uniref:Fimbrial biogenesis outer membrane usher protein n=1 Tax=Limnobaculum allomyrinae TaxID=2791986 RepID=A0ABS1IMZ4_9GAMM|nr:MULTISPECIES: fimbria/pilus outer membrane usher protein [Limnobaculum]MBK5143113.1 fimbrial biogenesis outer membrane usher protein [Limnobaculum allomyrinae]MBV7693443.1 fimbrial biogenesis outer membrane usher protein [Limnobaculum sp. M2-1]